MLAITIHFFSEKRARKNRLFSTYIKKNNNKFKNDLLFAIFARVR